MMHFSWSSWLGSVARPSVAVAHGTVGPPLLPRGASSAAILACAVLASTVLAAIIIVVLLWGQRHVLPL